MIKIFLILVALILFNACNTLGAKFSINVSNVYFVSSLKEICVEFEVEHPPGSLIVSPNSLILFQARINNKVYQQTLSQNTCLWHAFGRFSLEPGTTKLFLCTQGFEQPNPDDQVSIVGNMTLSMDSPSDFSACGTDNETITETQPIMYSSKIEKQIYHNKSVIHNPCSLKNVMEICTNCHFACETLLFGGQLIECEDWWDTFPENVFKAEKGIVINAGRRRWTIFE